MPIKWLLGARNCKKKHKKILSSTKRVHIVVTTLREDLRRPLRYYIKCRNPLIPTPSSSDLCAGPERWWSE